MPNPQIQGCIICEGARQEVLGKWTLLGFFGLAPNVRVQIAEFAKPVTLCFVFAGGEAAGKFRITSRLTAPNGDNLPGPGVEGDLLPGRPTTIFFMQYFSVLPGPGRYKIILAANGQDIYDTTFELAQGDAQEMLRKQRPS
jgi:hypothetical protein